MERPIEVLLKRWLDHSQNVRVSVLESVADSPRGQAPRSDNARWQSLRQFVERYGHDLFSQQLLMYHNLRAILHQGVETFLDSLREEPGAAAEIASSVSMSA